MFNCLLTYLRAMIDFSREQARAQGRLRTSTKHGQEEWRVVTSEKFRYSDTRREQTKMSGEMEVEETLHVMWQQ